MICLNPDAFTFRYVLEHLYVFKTPIKQATLAQMRASLVRWEEFCATRGEEPPVRDMDEELFAHFLIWLDEVKRLAPSTQKSKRKDLVTLWRFAQASKFACVPSELRAVHLPKVNPEAWSAAEIKLILGSADRHHHAAEMVATIRVCWDTCCRISAVHTALAARFNPRRATAALYESKTMTERAYSLTPATIAALGLLPASRKLLCGDVCLKSRWRWLNQVLAAAGFPTDRRSKFHRIRRSKYTAVTIKYGLQAAADHAGHSDTSMGRFYNDTSLHPPADCVGGLGL